MKRLLPMLALLAGSVFHLAAAADTVRVDGGQMSGVVANGVRVYKGIPYAAPPVGDLRWRPPQAVRPWKGVKDGSVLGYACPQVLRNPDTAARLQLDPLEPQNEDCLYLNVWTTARKGQALPVMVWIHGGGFQYGSGVQYTRDGGQLARNGVVVVTVNYRLGALGFLAHPWLSAESPHHASGNYALLDQIAALKWVQRNIAQFGGDPRRVTLFGYSAGAWSLNSLMASPLARGLFQRGIGESGGRFQKQRTLAEAEQAGVVFAKDVGASSLEALRKLPAEKTLLTPAFGTPPPNTASFFAEEVVDGWVLPASVRETFERGTQYEVPLILGSNADEPAGAAEQALAWARATATSHKVKAFLYRFTHIPPHPLAAQVRAYHGAEVPYVFNDIAQHAWAFTPVDHRLADVMSNYWATFAASGDPNRSGLPRWDAYDLEREAYMNFGDVIAGATRTKQESAVPPTARYRTIENWARLPPEVTLKQVASVVTDRAGNVVAFHRGEPPILVFAPDGTLLKKFAVEMFVKSHGLSVDKDGNIWATDADGKNGKGHQVFKFTPDGKVLLTLGTPGKAGDGPNTFNGPTAVAVAPNGDIFVTDGHYTNNRVVKFSKDGTFIKAWGAKGSAPGEFSMPHCIAIDSQGRVFVGDRENSRIQIFDQDGKLLDQWKQFGRPAGMYIAPDDTLYVTDSDSNQKVNPGFKRGIWIGSARTGAIRGFIPDTEANPEQVQYSGADGVAADAKGDIYAGGIASGTIRKYVRE